MANDSNVSRNTPTVQPQTLPSVEITASPTTGQSKENVLNTYRSYTYNFTLAVLSKDDLSNPENYRNKPLKNVIAKSGGKGPIGIATPSSDTVSAAKKKYADESTSRSATVESVAAAKSSLNSAMSLPNMVGGFNENSPGRFDFFIDNVEIETRMAFSPASSFTLPTSIKFDIFEPYSINGFFEALHVAALAGDYSSYTESGLVMKVEFVGYNDKDALPEPEKIPKSSRYITFLLNNVKVELTEKGTRYSCAGRPWDQSALGSANQTTEPVSAEGNTVKEILENLFKNRNEQLARADKLGKAGAEGQNHDLYEIKFPSIVDGKEEPDTDNEMASAVLSTALKDNQLFNFSDPATSTKSNALQTGNAAASSTPADYVMKNTKVQLPEGRQLSESITAILRDSSYAREILANIKSKTDSNGFIKYFFVETEVTPLKTYDAIAKRQHLKYTFKVLPYKIHFSKVPSLIGTPFSTATLDPLCWRKYNYIYTGKNVDVLNFKLNFDFLSVATLPNANANNDTPGSKTAAAPDGAVVVKNKPVDKKVIQAEQTPSSVTIIDPKASSLQPTDGAAGQISDDPYWALARHMHNAVVDSTSGSLLRGEIEILGDPFYLVTGGVGNRKVKEELPGITTDGEATYNRGDVLIRIDFKNPIDINPLEQGGLLKFDNRRVPFGGIYIVNKAVSTFREGQFKQVLTIARMVGQVEPNSLVKPDSPANRTETTADSSEAVKTDTARPSPAIPVVPSIKIPIPQPPSLAPLAEISAKDLLSAPLATAVSGFKNPLSSLVDSKSIVSSVITKFKP